MFPSHLSLLGGAAFRDGRRLKGGIRYHLIWLGLVNHFDEQSFVVNKLMQGVLYVLDNKDV
jgi:hypothetical protein